MRLDGIKTKWNVNVEDDDEEKRKNVGEIKQSMMREDFYSER